MEGYAVSKRSSKETSPRNEEAWIGACVSWSPLWNETASPENVFVFFTKSFYSHPAQLGYCLSETT